MPPSDNAEALRAAVENELHRLEVLCGDIERALMRRNWTDMEAAIADSRRITHALQNAMDDAAHVRDALYDEAVGRRLHYIDAIRENQMTRLQQYQDAVGERLQLTARWKSALRSIGKREPVPSRLGSLDRLS
ncbi:MAG: hypothetical protein ABR508_02460 [Candidatus Baltobacteraceae bacterium]